MNNKKNKKEIYDLNTFCWELPVPVAVLMGEVLARSVAWLCVACGMATVEIFWPSDVVMTTGTCIATRTVLQTRKCGYPSISHHNLQSTFADETLIS